MMYISATAALYSEMYSFGMALVIWSFKIYVNTNCLAYCLSKIEVPRDVRNSKGP